METQVLETILHWISFKLEGEVILVISVPERPSTIKDDFWGFIDIPIATKNKLSAYLYA